MATIDDVQQKLDFILSGPRKGKAITPIATPSTTNLSATAAPTPRPLPSRRPFSSFVPRDVQRVSEVTSRLVQVAERKGGVEGLNDALFLAIQQAGTETPGLMQHAVKLFVTHYPPARENLLWKPLEKRQPDLVRPSAAVRLDGAAPAQTGSTPPENKVDFWREDPLINEHHEHWHLVYPTSPTPGSNTFSLPDTYALGNRHGELFAYMHEQMLARYDAERLAVGLPRVTPFKPPYTQPIPTGYDPGLTWIWDGEQWYQFRARPHDANLTDLTGKNASGAGSLLSDQAKYFEAMCRVGTEGHFALHGKRIPATMDAIGNSEEANNNSIDPNYSTAATSVYGNHHNIGHVHFALFDDQQSDPVGVMYQTATAVRDPVFFHWHKNVDQVYQSFQNHLPPYDFADAPPVVIRKSSDEGLPVSSVDIILCSGNGLALGAQFGDIEGGLLSIDPQLAGTLAFGYFTDPYQNNWNTDFSATTTTIQATFHIPQFEGPDTPQTKSLQITTTDTLTTEMRQRQVEVASGVDANGYPILTSETINYLSHEDFYYFIRVHNTDQDNSQSVTARIFLVPETEVEDRTAWIEMDRFLYTLQPDERAVIYRPADLSAVVRKPALKWNGLEPSDEPSPEAEKQPWCDCGWPYTLLLPRGKAEGMAFRLFVMFSNGSDLKMPPPRPGQCSSLSYCGLKDWDYPDTRDMGYPFNRPFAQSITDTVAAQANMAWRSIKIRCSNLPAVPQNVAPATVTDTAAVHERRNER